MCEVDVAVFPSPLQSHDLVHNPVFFLVNGAVGLSLAGCLHYALLVLKRCDSNFHFLPKTVVLAEDCAHQLALKWSLLCRY